MAAWYKCSSCHVLLENIHKFIVHNFKHQYKGGDDGESQLHLAHSISLFHSETGDSYSLDDLPVELTTGIFTPKIQLTSIEDSSAEFMVEIKSPTVLVPFIETGRSPQLQLPLFHSYSSDEEDDVENKTENKTQKGRSRVLCEFCHRELWKLRFVPNHLLSCLKGPNASKLLCCPIEHCVKTVPKGFRTPHFFWNHFTSYHRVQARYHCDNCHQGFSQKQSLRDHRTYTNCTAETPCSLNEEVRVRKRSSGKVVRIAFVFCPHCNLKMKKKVLNGHMLTCNQRREGTITRFHCPFNQCLTEFDNNIEFTEHFNSCHSDIAIDTRDELAIKFQRIIESLNTIKGAGPSKRISDAPSRKTISNRKPAVTVSKRIISNQNQGVNALKKIISNKMRGVIASKKLISKYIAPTAGYPFRIYIQPDGRSRKVFLKPCPICGIIKDSKNYAKHVRTCKGEGDEGNKSSSDIPSNNSLLKSHNEKPNFKTEFGSKQVLEKDLNGLVNENTVCSVVPSKEQILTKEKRIPPSVGNKTLAARLRKTGMRQCPCCGSVMLKRSLPKHLRYNCKNKLGTFKSKPVKITEYFKPISQLTPVQSKEEKIDTESDQPVPVNDIDLNASIKEEITDVTMENETNTDAQSTPSHSPKKIAIGRNKSRGKIQMRFNTRCRFCGSQVCSSNLARHISKCKIKKKQEQEAEEKKVEEDETTKLEAMEVLESENGPMEGVETSDSKFRPRSTCPFCKTVQVAGSMATHVLTCIATFEQFGHQDKMKNELVSQNKSVDPAKGGEMSGKRPFNFSLVKIRREGGIYVKQKPQDSRKSRKKMLSKCARCSRFVKIGGMVKHLEEKCGKLGSKLEVHCTRPGCLARVSNLNNLKVHIRVRHGPNLTCEYCGHSYSTARSFYKHFMRFVCGHKLLGLMDTEPSNSTNKPSNRTSIAASKKILAASKVRIRKAKAKLEVKVKPIITKAKMRKPQPRIDWNCPDCGVVISHKSMSRHVRESCKGRKTDTTADEPPVQPSQTLLFCTQNGCDSIFISAQDLENHVTQYHVQKINYQCTTCKKQLVESLAKINEHRKSCQLGGGNAIHVPSQTNILRTILTDAKKPKPKPANRPGTSAKPKSVNSQPTSKPKPVKRKAPVVRMPVSEDGMVYECDCCHKRVNTESGLRQHKRRCSIKNDSLPVDNKWNCIFCIEGFESPKALSEHIRSDCHSRRDEDVQEQDPLNLQLQLKQEVIDERRSSFEGGESEGDMKCGYCQKQFPTTNALMLHFRTPCTLVGGNGNGPSSAPKEVGNGNLPSKAHINVVTDEQARLADGVRIKMEDESMVDEIFGDNDPLADEDESIY